MSTVKRRNSSDQDGSAPPKKQRRDRHTKGGQPDVDETYGQRYVFANLDDPTAPSSDEEFEVEDEGDALAYLRSVRLVCFLEQVPTLHIPKEHLLLKHPPPKKS